MKKVLFLALATAVCCLFAVTETELRTVSASPNSDKSDTRSKGEKNPEMARAIERVTDRSGDGLVEERTAIGTMIDLKGRFQNVMLARHDDSGETEDACVTSLGEANSFFGTDLETGARLARTEFPETVHNHENGMSQAEYDFYARLIEDAKSREQMKPASATITIQNADSAGEGFNDATATASEGGNNGATRGQQRLNVFQYAASIWGAFVDTSIPIVINSKFDPLPCSSSSAVLGQAGTTNIFRDFPGQTAPGTWHHAALTNKLYGGDGNGSAAAEISATFNSTFDGGCFSGGHRFYYGFDNSTPANRTNLLVVVLHEMGHGLGFSTFANVSTGALLGGYPDVYTQYIYDATQGLTWNQMNDAQRQASAVNNGNVYWDGPNVKIASGFLGSGRDAATGRVALYTPSTFASGSSVSHFSTAASPNLLMEPSINSGIGIDGDLARQQLRDIGWFRDTTSDATADTITGVGPSGGVAVVGSGQLITWTNNGSFGGNVTIELSTDGGATYPTVIASNIANFGNYTWTVPNMPTSTARVRVREADFVAPSGTSSGNFMISSAATAGGVTVSGRVATSNGRAVSKAFVTLVDADGNVRTAMSNAWGYFAFYDVPAGRTYAASVKHKQFRFQVRSIDLGDDFANLDFTASN